MVVMHPVVMAKFQAFKISWQKLFYFGICTKDAITNAYCMWVVVEIVSMLIPAIML